MGEPARRLATWDDLLSTPDDGRVWEVLGGNLEAQPRPQPTHGAVQGLLFADLADPFYQGRGGSGGWWLVIEPDVELEPHEIVVPDLAGWRTERMPGPPTERPVRSRPDWVCEVASPSNRRRDYVHKADLYLRAGIPHYWIAEPEERTLQAFEARGGGPGSASARGRTATSPASRPSTPSPSTWAASFRPCPDWRGAGPGRA